jgi:hypothetical protein
MERGYVKLYRKTLDSPVFSNPNLFKLWTFCLLMGSYKESPAMAGLVKPLSLRRGQFPTGRYALQKALYPTGSKDPPSPETCWRWLKALQDMGNISIESKGKFSVVTVINWDMYQSAEDSK